jgi:hypothetical protein
VHCDGVVVTPASHVYVGTAPSAPMGVGSTHATLFETVPFDVHVHVEGQSLSLVQGTATT